MSAANNTDLLIKELKQNQVQERVIFQSKNKRDQVKAKAVGNEKVGQSIGGAFANYNLSVPVLKAIKAKGYNLPTPI